MEHTLKRKVTVKLTFTEPSPTRHATRSNVSSRPVSPLKLPVDSVPKPRAKVTSAAPGRKPANSVSNVSHTRSVVPPRSRPGTSDGPSSRPSSPSKLRTQPALHVRAQTASSQRPATPRSNPTTLHLRHRSQTSLRDLETRDRPTAAPLHHAVSHSSLHASNLSSTSSHSLLDTGTYSDADSPTHSLSVRIKAKVSSSLSPTTTSQPAFPDTRQKTHSPRVPSASSTVSPPLSHVFYPITTATPAANPHRYAPKSPPQTALHHYQSSPPNVPPLRRNGLARVDPATIPLPASSPPASALSFSSRSSVSRSSASYTTDSAATSSSQHAHSSADPDPLQATLAHLVQFKELGGDQDNLQGADAHNVNLTERKVRAEAKSNRKIADLEITNRSLLTINASLESQKHKQAKEIRELRRKLRESRLILPPRTYRAVESSLGHSDKAEDDEEEDDDDDDGEKNDVGDEAYQRIKAILEELLESGRRALERKPEELLPSGGTKVLSADEIRNWRDSSGGGSDRTLLPDDNDQELGADDSVSSTHLSSPLVRGDFLSDSDDVEFMGESHL